MKKVAIFIDHENLVHSSEKVIGEKYNIEVLLEEANKEGRVIIGKVYVPFLPDSFKRNSYLYNFHKNGIDPVYTPSYEQSNNGEVKSLGDPMLICDVMQSLYEYPQIDVFVICSGDKDMVPLIRKLAQMGKEVLVIGVAATSAQILINECSRLKFRYQDYQEMHRPITRRAE
ncbi:NYN domain-containing protein [Candidatus Aerophobetes bacterium]|nr:NYN domain-containing protein [Candidatus Aerophobetes bacterium]